MIAGETIGFGELIKPVDGAWMRSSLADMTAVSARPVWANRTRGGEADLPSAFEAGEEVEVKPDGSSFMIVLPERMRRPDGTVLLAGQPEYVTVRAGRLVGLEAF